jgi:endo-1,3(4)-beta-glucanase
MSWPPHQDLVFEVASREESTMADSNHHHSTVLRRMLVLSLLAACNSTNGQRVDAAADLAQDGGGKADLVVEKGLSDGIGAHADGPAPDISTRTDGSEAGPKADLVSRDAGRTADLPQGREDASRDGNSMADGARDLATEPTQGDAGLTWHLDPGRPLSAEPCPFPQKTHALQPTDLWSSALKSPRPTNAFWMNLVLDKGDQRINVLPYHVKALATGLTVALPSLTAADTSVTTSDASQWIFGAVESLDGHQVTKFDDLSVTVTWTGGSKTLQAPIVYGMPYASAKYDGLTPNLQAAAGVAITQVNDAKAAGTLTAQKLTVVLNNGQTWNVYAPSALAWTWSSSGIRAADPLQGYVRVAYQPAAAAAAVLDQFAAAVPVGGDVDLGVAGDTGHVRFDWRREGSGDLLMMAMPHHQARLSSGGTQPFALPSLSGTLTAMAGDSWILRYPLSTIAWSAPRAVDDAAKADIQAALQADANYVPAEKTSPYFAGKQLAKLARLALMARELGSGTLADGMTGNLRKAATSWLDGSNPNPLVYDKTWGGVVTTAGIADSGADFGQGYYNDHHFHYGYHVYAAAVLMRDDPAFAASYADKALCLLRDFANPSVADPYFPRVRNFDWFVGHSWAAGLFSFGDNRNQESTAEAVNAAYAVELFGRAQKDEDLTNLGRILRAMEVASAQAYWQVPEASTVYPAPFKSHHVVGVLWSTKVDFATFFGSNPEYIYGIQMLPFTPASEDLLAPAWIKDSAAQLASAGAGATEQGWKGFMAMARAVVDLATAASEVRALTGYDDGNSKANTLYWLATRPR